MKDKSCTGGASRDTEKGGIGVEYRQFVQNFVMKRKRNREGTVGKVGMEMTELTACV